MAKISTFATFISHFTEVWMNVRRKEKEIKGIHFGNKEWKLLFPDYINHLHKKCLIENLLKLTSEFSKFAWYKNSILFLFLARHNQKF